MIFRLLKADEIEARISICNQYGVKLLLYKDARCDQNILDETVGSMNWQRHHKRDNANCIISIWDSDKKQWIEKEDTGTESFTEKEKGLASDSFKRAAFNWGIGRELYTSPDMFVYAKDLKNHSQDNNGKWLCKDIFKVTDIDYVNRKICYVKIMNVKNGKEIEFGCPSDALKEQEETENSIIGESHKNTIVKLAKEKGVEISKIFERYKINSLDEMKMIDWIRAMEALKKTGDK